MNEPISGVQLSLFEPIPPQTPLEATKTTPDEYSVDQVVSIASTGIFDGKDGKIIHLHDGYATVKVRGFQTPQLFPVVLLRRKP